MRKLSDPDSLTTFCRCQLCGFESDDICEFYQWVEADEQDRPTDQLLITCRQSSCQAVIDEHPRLYIAVPWGAGKPGQFMLLCGDCPNRSNSSCTHPDLKANGGEGLEVSFSSTPLSAAIVCYTDGTCSRVKRPAVKCKGKP